jgi:hypothetical protein
VRKASLLPSSFVQLVLLLLFWDAVPQLIPNKAMRPRMQIYNLTHIYITCLHKLFYVPDRFLVCLTPNTKPCSFSFKPRLRDKVLHSASLNKDFLAQSTSPDPLSLLISLVFKSPVVVCLQPEKGCKGANVRMGR